MSANPIPPLHLYSVPSDSQPEAAALPKRERPRTAWTADQLMAADFPEPKWAVPGILAEGVSLPAGPPKVGKSWLSLGLALAVAAGGNAFDSVPVQGGPVLYLALEDTPRRLQTRMGKLLGGQQAPAGLTLVTECPPFPQGGVEAIAGWLDRNPDARMVVIDVFAKMRGQAPQGVSAYDADYVSAGYAKRLADHYGIAVVLVHHVRKMASEDFLTEVSGTNGIAGAADATLVLKRARGQADGILHVTGRDVNEAEYALQFQDASGAWHLLDGPVTDHTVGDTRAAILRHVRAHPGAKPKDIAEALPGSDADTCKNDPDSQNCCCPGCPTSVLKRRESAVLEPHLSVREAAVFLGGERFVRRLTAERRITYIKDQRRVLIPESAVTEFLAARTVPALESRTRRRRRAA